MLRALDKATTPSADLYKRIQIAKNSLLDIEKELQGDKIKGEVGARNKPNASEGNSIGWRALGNTYGPTGEHKAFLARVQSQLRKVKDQLSPIINGTLPSLEADLKTSGAPWIEGQGLIKN